MRRGGLPEVVERWVVGLSEEEVIPERVERRMLREVVGLNEGEVVPVGRMLLEVVKREVVGLNEEVVPVVERGGLYLNVPKHFTTRLGSPLNSISVPGIGFISI